MCPFNFLKGLIIALILCFLLTNRLRHTEASPTNGDSTNHIRTRNGRFSPRLSGQSQFPRRVESLPDFLGEDDDLFEMIKRQSDDYGHMRFGKREFDDYGHMRFGKSVSEK